MSRQRRRVMLQSGPKLDLRALRPQPQTTKNTAYSYTNGLRLAVRLEVRATDGEMTLEFEGQRQRVALEGLPRGFGGVQWYMRCPRTRRRTLTLWMPPGSPIFASRHAWPRQVAYAVQFEDATGRAWRAMRRVVHKLGGEDPNDYDLPEKPRWMRWETYHRLVDRYEAAEGLLDQQLAMAVSGILRRYGPAALDGFCD